MLKVLVLLDLAVFLALIPVGLLTLLRVRRFQQSLAEHHPDLGRVSLLKAPSTPGLSAPTLAAARAALPWFWAAMAMFAVVLLSGLLLSALLP